MQVFTAADKLIPGVTWKQNSVLTADFTCRGRTEYALLGTVKSEAAGSYAIVAVFLDGLNKQPELLKDMARNLASIELTVESLDYDAPEIAPGVPGQGFESSKTCKGLNLADGETDSRHIFWNHVFHGFDSWSL